MRSDPTRYAGYETPRQLIDDPVLSHDEKVETLKHWQATATRLAHGANDGEREAYERITAEIGDALERMDRSAHSTHSSWRPHR